MKRFDAALLFLSSFSIGIATIILITVLLLCVISVFPCHWLQSLLLSKGEHGIFNVRSDCNASCTLNGESGTNWPAQVLTRKNRKNREHIRLLGHCGTVCFFRCRLRLVLNKCQSVYFMLCSATADKKIKQNF